jgi:hypothetical protein
MCSGQHFKGLGRHAASLMLLLILQLQWQVHDCTSGVLITL